MSEYITIKREILEQILSWIHYQRRVQAMDEPVEEQNLRIALAQQKQEKEPVAWVDEASIAWLAEHPRGIITTRLVKQKSPERQMAMYAEPPRREWQGLKELEINDGRDQLPTEDLCNWSFRQGVYFAETKLKEKNA